MRAEIKLFVLQIDPDDLMMQEKGVFAGTTETGALKIEESISEGKPKASL
jgi:hypothetical protein